MNDQMNPLAQFSPKAGVLTEVIVSGAAEQVIEFENDMEVAKGADRTMFCYAPLSGCPDAKQTQVLYVLRNEYSRESAEALMERLQIRELSEQEHFIVLFPNPAEGGWKYNSGSEEHMPGNSPVALDHAALKAEDAACAGSNGKKDAKSCICQKGNTDSDIDFMSRCFNILKQSEMKISGFNGMLFYVAADEESSAMLMTMAARRPVIVSAMLTGNLPEGYVLPAEALGIETAVWCKPGLAADYFSPVNGPECRCIVDERNLSAEVLWEAWDKLFSLSRRWQNDTYGHYQPRTEFTKRGFVAHVNDSSLGVNEGYPHTWFEYIPPQLRGTKEKVPLVFYFHGINCVPLYGAEQSCWHEIADRENFIVVYPAPAKYKAWNIFDLPNMVSDIDFVMALIEHMKEVHPIDESRIYSTGFSMGGAMTHALTSAYPEVFAAAAPCNAFMMARFQTPAENLGPFLPLSKEELGAFSYSSMLADTKKDAMPALRMPVFQNMGLADGLIAGWPLKEGVEDMRTKTIDYWKSYNGIPLSGDGISSTEESNPAKIRDYVFLSVKVSDEEGHLRSNTAKPADYLRNNTGEEEEKERKKTENICPLTGYAADETFFEDEAERYIHQRWYEPATGIPMLEMVGARRMPHAIDPVQIEMAWKYIRQFSRNVDGSLTYEKS